MKAVLVSNDEHRSLNPFRDEVANKAIHGLRIDDLSLWSDAAITEQKADIQTQLLQETRQRLFGRNASAWGSLLSVHDELWFFPNQIQFS